MGIIYCFTNTINQKKYIGQTINPRQRYHQHKSSAFNVNDGDYNSVFHRAVRKYGWEKFEYQILCATEDLNELNDLEKYYINKFNSLVPNGYNVKEGGSNASPPPMSLERKVELTWEKGKLSEEEIKYLRYAYANKESPKKIYDEQFKDRLHYQAFLNIWSGRRYKNILPEMIEKGRHTKLNEEIVYNIRLDRQLQQLSYDALAEKYGISKSTIADIIRGRTWKNVQIEPVSTIPESGEQDSY